LPVLLIDFNSFLPKNYVDAGAIIVLIIVIIGITFAILRWRSALANSLPRLTRYTLSAGTKTKILAENLGIDVFYQKSIADCSRPRWVAHMAMFWGFLGLAATTTLDEIVNPSAGPLPLTSPVRILGNISGVLFIAGISYSLGRRLLVSSVRKNSSRGDAIFLLMLFLTAVTGFTTEIFSDLNIFFPDGFSYWFHLLLVAALLATAPFSKFVHSIGRPILLLVKRSENQKAKQRIIETTGPLAGQKEDSSQ
jgi:hypothetical protein